MNNKILFVDDDERILSSFQRNLKNDYEIEIALGGELGLSAIMQLGPFAVVVADMGMPGMNGIEFLTKVKKISPDSVRMMLTGNSDQRIAITAVNEGNIFRFLTKPCPTEQLKMAIDDGIKQYELIVAEKELLEKTLSGSVHLLIDILTLVNPLAFRRASRLKHFVGHIASNLKLSNLWQYELAAQLSQIGCVTLPFETLEKVYSGIELSSEEEKIYSSYPKVAAQLLSNIPRLDLIVQIIAGINDPSDPKEFSTPIADRAIISNGKNLLRLAIEFDKFKSQGKSAEQAIKLLLSRPNVFDPLFVAALSDVKEEKFELEEKSIKITNLDTRMILAQDVKTKGGLLVIAKGEKISYPVLTRLKNFMMSGAIEGNIKVLVPQ